MVKIKKSMLITFLLMGAFLLLMSCAEDESPVTPQEGALQLVLTSPSGVIPYKSTATYSWTARGGAGSYSYTYTFGNNPAETTPNGKVTFTELVAGKYVFKITVTDAKGATASDESDTLTVLDFDSSAIQNPSLMMDLAPEEGSELATGNSVTFVWSGTDASPDGGIKGYMYKIENTTDGSYLQETDSLTMATTVTFDNLTTGDYMFLLSATNVYDRISSDTVHFEVNPAHILWIDDHYWGGQSEEFKEKKNEWGVALSGFAYEELDMNETYTGREATLDIMDNKVNGAGSTIQTIVWDENGSNQNYLLWYSSNDSASLAYRPWLRDFLDNGGNLVLIGSNLLSQIYVDDHIPTDTVGYTPGDFEALYMGLDTFQDTVTTVTDIDTVLVQDPVSGNWYEEYIFTYDTTYRDPWDEDDYVTLQGENGYTDIIIDVAKDDATHQDAVVFGGIDATATLIFSDDDTNLPVGYVWHNPATGGKFVALGMNLYYSPTAQIRSVMKKILEDELGL